MKKLIQKNIFILIIFIIMTSCATQFDASNQSGQEAKATSGIKDLNNNSAQSNFKFTTLTWEDDCFDWLNANALAGQNGWTKANPNAASAKIVKAPGNDKEILLDPKSAHLIMVKGVGTQNNGKHVFGFRTKITSDGKDASMGKVEVKATTDNIAWDKKFQIYIGVGLRYQSLNNGSTALLNNIEKGQWYDIECLIDLDNNRVDIVIFKEGAVINFIRNLLMDDGPIAGLGISAWDLPGAVYIDDIFGYKINNPALSLESPPYKFDFGYYFVDSNYNKINSDPDGKIYNYFDEVADYTDLVYIGGNGNNKDWDKIFVKAVKNAVNGNKKIYLAFNMEGKQFKNGEDFIYPDSQKNRDRQLIKNVLDIKGLPSGWWDKVKYLELCDEPEWGNSEQIDLRYQLLEDVLKTYSQYYFKNSVGVCYNDFIFNDTGHQGKIKKSKLQWATFQAYILDAGDKEPDYYESKIEEMVNNFDDLLNNEQSMIIAMKAYDKDNTWKNLNTLTEMQFSTYRAAKMIADKAPKRLLALTMFSYGRPGGTRSHPVLQYAHRKIYNTISSVR